MMSYKDWKDCSNPTLMLEFLRAKTNNRKARLYACGCCRMIHRFFADQCFGTAIDVAERYADRKASVTELAEVQRAVAQVYQKLSSSFRWVSTTSEPSDLSKQRLFAANAVNSLARPTNDKNKLACMMMDVTNAVISAESVGKTSQEIDASRFGHCHYLSCIYGPLFFQQMVFDPAWRTSTVQDIATAIYDERSFDNMAILADALEEVGCASEEILSHCRNRGEHMRGCWVLDLILAKE